MIYYGSAIAEKRLMYWDLMCSLWKLFPMDGDGRLWWDIDRSLSHEKT